MNLKEIQQQTEAEFHLKFPDIEWGAKLLSLFHQREQVAFRAALEEVIDLVEIAKSADWNQSIEAQDVLTTLLAKLKEKVDN